ncbi:group II intron reverse transcriptase/maturase [Paenibacillus sp. GYB004]|uniref:group II intron reverse transcriptase/maturase n=1 Tax=Paenibacillus sp. GYB004 TaxID=2994393 RepID=UPI002F96757A
MQMAEVILGILEQASRESKEFTFNRIYRNFFNPDFFLTAYAKIHAKEGNMTEGTDGTTADGFSLEKVDEVITLLKTESYHFRPARRTYIPKKSGGQRPLGIPSFMDKIVQEIARALLESIYESKFSKSSHGFRPNKSCHTALKQIKREWTGVKWVIEGDIKGFFDNIDHDQLLGILSEKIKDGRFIELIRRMLTAGYMEDWKFHETYSGTPQGGIVSPILANIYLDKLDKFVEEVIIPKYETKKVKRRNNPGYYAVNHQLRKLSGMINTTESCRETKKRLIREYKALKISRRQLKVLDPMDSEFVRVKYVRYADDFVIGIIGSKAIAHQIKQEIADFLNTELKLTLSMEKTVITHFPDKRTAVKFLGYEIYSGHDDGFMVERSDKKKARAINELPRLRLPSQAIYNKLSSFTKDGRAIHRMGWTSLDLAEIISKFSSEIRGLYNYYRLADSVAHQMGKFRFYHRASLIKTIAVKMKVSSIQVVKKYNVDDTIGLVIKRGPNKKDLIYKYYCDGFEKNDWVDNANLDPDRIPATIRITGRNGIIKRLLANKCEICNHDGSDRKYEVHHVRKLKDLKKKYQGKIQPPSWVKLMIARNRKTMVLCVDCHYKLHNNKL